MKYRVGDLSIDTGRQLVQRAGEPVALAKLSFDLLLTLVRAAPDVVSLDELMQRVWPGLVVSPETVVQRVKMLRDALGDDSRSPRYVAGLRGRGYQLVATVDAAHEVAMTAVAAAAISPKSVAVVPFVDMSQEHDQEYFADGLAEELINLLAKIPELRVPARTSSFYFKGKSEDIPTIARRLMVAHVLEGSVRKSGDRLRVSAQLVRADTGYQLWSQSYDRHFDDVFRIQDDIAAAVVGALEVTLLGAPARRSAPTKDSGAYSLYLQAEALARRGTSVDSLQAHADLKRALQLDPKFALAWSALSALYTDDNVEWSRVFPAAGDPRPESDLATQIFLLGTNRVALAAHDAAANAVALEPDAAYTHRALANVMWWFDFNWEGAAAELEKSRTLEPGNAQTARQAVQLCVTVGRFEEALAQAEKAEALDPLGMMLWETGKAHFRLGALDAAAAAYRRLMELHPTRAGVYSKYATVLLAQNQPQAALGELKRDAPWYRDGTAPLVLDALGRRAESDAALALAERSWGGGMAYQISYVYAARGEADAAVRWLERAYRQRDAGLLSIVADPMLRSIADHPGYRALMRTLKLPA